MHTVFKRSGLSVFLLTLLMLALFAMPARAQAGGILHDVSWYNPSSTTFTLTTREQLYGLADIVNGVVPGVSENFKDKTIMLGTDISMNHDVDQYATWDCETAETWTPIGSISAFQGTFRGQGHAISGLFLSVPMDENQGQSAFFGTIGNDAIVTDVVFSKTRLYTENSSQNKSIAPVFLTNFGTISGVRVKDLSAYGTSNVSGFGIVNNGTVKNCRVYNFSSNAHSIVSGFIYSNQFTATINSCGVEGMNVTATGLLFHDNFYAGLVFHNSGSLKNSYINRGNFSFASGYYCSLSTLSYDNSGSIENCYAQANASSNIQTCAILLGAGAGTVRNVYSSAADPDPNIKTLYVVDGTRFYETGTGKMLTQALNLGRNNAKGDRNWTWDAAGFPAPVYLIQLVDSAEVFGPKWAVFGEPITMLTPSRTNYEFGGWYLDAALTHKWDPANDFFIDDSIMFCKWTKLSVDATLTPATLNFDIYHPEDATATLDHGTQTFQNLKSGDTTLTQGTDYTLAGKVLTIKSDFMKTLGAGNHTIAVCYSTCADLSLTIKVSDSAPQRTVTAKGTTGGTVEANPVSAQRGEKITLTAKPDDGYKFVSFTVDGERITGDSFTMPDKNVEVSAVYELINVDPTIKPITLDFDKYHPEDATATLDNGTQTLSGLRSGETTLTEGSDYTLEGKVLTIKSDFMKKLGIGNHDIAVCYSTGSKLTLTVKVADSAPQRTITVKKTTGGTVRASATSAQRGKKITLAAKPKEGYRFISFALNGKRISGKSFTMPDKNVEVSAVYKLKTFTIAAPVSSTKAGRVVGARTVSYGGTLKLTARARSGYHFVRWTKGGKAISKNNVLVVKSVKSSATYKAVFAKTSVLFKLKRVSGGRITVRWESAKGASSYQIVSKRAAGSSYHVRWTGKNSTRLYTSINKHLDQTYLYKMRYSKIIRGKRVWSSWTPAKSIK